MDQLEKALQEARDLQNRLASYMNDAALREAILATDRISTRLRFHAQERGLWMGIRQAYIPGEMDTDHIVNAIGMLFRASVGYLRSEARAHALAIHSDWEEPWRPDEIGHSYTSYIQEFIRGDEINAARAFMDATNPITASFYAVLESRQVGLLFQAYPYPKVTSQDLTIPF